MLHVAASTLVSPSQTEIAKACAVVDSAGMVMVQEKESQEDQGASIRHQEPGETWDMGSEARHAVTGIILTSCQ